MRGCAPSGQPARMALVANAGRSRIWPHRPRGGDGKQQACYRVFKLNLGPLRV